MIGAPPAAPNPRIILPTPHPGQQHVLRTARRFNWLAAGRRWRKTTLCMAIAVDQLLKGRSLVWGGPTYDQVRIGWSELRHAAGAVATFNQATMTVTFPKGGGIIRFRSLDDPDNARGHTADGVVIDEAADVDPRAWDEVLRPMLVDTGGWLWACSSPRGRNWFFERWQAAQDQSDAMAWQAPTLGCRIRGQDLVRAPHPLENPDIPFAEVQALWATTPEDTFRQELLGEFVDESGGVFRGVRAVCRLEPCGRTHGHQYVLGVDFAETNDFTAVSVFDASLQELAALDRFHNTSFDDQLERIGVLADHYRPQLIVAEGNSIGAPLIERLQTGWLRVDGSWRAGLPVMRWTTTAASKRTLIETLALAIETGRVTLLDDDRLIGELLSYQVERLPGGTLRFGAPRGGTDDTVIATALAVLHGQPDAGQTTRGTYGFAGGRARAV